MFFSRICIVFGPIFRFLIHFEFIFVYSVRGCSHVITLHVINVNFLLWLLQVWIFSICHLLLSTQAEEAGTI